MRLDLGIEIEVVVAQPLEPLEIFVMINRCQQAADLAEVGALPFAAERSALDQGVDELGLADRDEPLVLGRRAGAARAVRRHCAVW
jgi:hypothetical protein